MTFLLSLSLSQDYSLYRYMYLWYMPHESVLAFVGNLEVTGTPCHMFMNWWRFCLTYKKFFSSNTVISWLFWELTWLNALMLSVLPCRQSSELQDGLQNQTYNHNSIFIFSQMHYIIRNYPQCKKIKPYDVPGTWVLDVIFWYFH